MKQTDHTGLIHNTADLTDSGLNSCVYRHKYGLNWWWVIN